MMQDEQQDRLYALNLLNRSGVGFDARDVATVAKCVALVEADMKATISTWTEAANVDDDHSPVFHTLHLVSTLIETGEYRPTIVDLGPGDTGEAMEKRP